MNDYEWKLKEPFLKNQYEVLKEYIEQCSTIITSTNQEQWNAGLARFHNLTNGAVRMVGSQYLLDLAGRLGSEIGTFIADPTKRSGKEVVHLIVDEAADIIQRNWGVRDGFITLSILKNLQRRINRGINKVLSFRQ